MRTRTIGAALLLLLLFSVRLGAQPNDVTLRLHREAGQVLRYRAELSGTGAIVMLGEQQPVNVRGRFARVERTLSQVEPGVWEVRVTVEQPSLTFRAGKEQETVTMQVPPLTQVVTERGAVREVRGWEAAPTVSAPGMGDAVRPLFGLIQDEGLPEQPVRAGDRWTARAKLKMADGPDLEVTQNCELVGFEEVGGVRCARLRSSAQIPVRRVLPPNALAMQVRLEGTQRLETTSLFAYEQGCVLRQDTVMNLDLKTATVVSAEAPERTIPGEISLRVTANLQLER